MKFRVLIVAALFLIGCAKRYDVRAREPLELPDLATLNTTERLGYELFLMDRAAWKATDAALAAGLETTPAQGWITILNPQGWTVRFIGPCDAGNCSFMDVESDGVEARPVVVSGIEEPLPDDQASQWRARQLAGASDFRRCTETYNTVVVDWTFQNQPAWRIYLLASSTDSRDVVLTGHHRITVSRDGREILLKEPLSKSCVVQRPPKNVVGLVLTHILDPEPIETHVFTSLDYQMPLYIGTESGQFEVRGPKIRRIAE